MPPSHEASRFSRITLAGKLTKPLHSVPSPSCTVPPSSFSPNFEATAAAVIHAKVLAAATMCLFRTPFKLPPGAPS
ncbi:hypothetical protein E2562_029125 [Oryza meyeriana var. granulata]|uniref:Uncharacterized protein n=1 Tax=Oryza meyeriana var. granulata TaxID=110450 RepID=A0A6G1ECQ5_9ORYZ|nr:hypothetical protein E2562_029125 [Oryza meyeriana var. granulata]